MQAELPHSPERIPANYPAWINMENMRPQDIQLLKTAIASARDAAGDDDFDRYVELDSQFSRGLALLPEQNIEKAVEVLEFLAASESAEDRAAAADSFGYLIQHECIGDHPRLHHHVTIWLELLNDPNGNVLEAALLAMHGAIESGWMPQEIAARIDEAWAD